MGTQCLCVTVTGLFYCGKKLVTLECMQQSFCVMPRFQGDGLYRKAKVRNNGIIQGVSSHPMMNKFCTKCVAF